MSTTPKSFVFFVASLLVLPYATIPLQVLSASSEGISISVTDGRKTIHAGGTLIYALHVSNQSGDTETVDIEFDVPDYTTIISPSNGGELRSGKVYWSNMTMSPNSNVVLNVQVTLVPNIEDGTVLTATAYADDVRSTDTTVIGTSVIPQKSFKVSVTDNKKTVSPTEEITYTATVKNVSNTDEVTDVHFSLSQFVTIVDIDSDARVNNNSVTWYNVELPAGTSKTYVIDGHVERFAAEYYLLTTKLQAGGVTATDLTSVQTNVEDLMNNDDDANDAKIKFSVYPDSTEVLPGGRIRYSVSVRNADSTKVNDLVATVKFDPSVAVLLNAGKAEKVNASTLQWDVPSLAAGETWRTTFELALVDGLPLGTSIPVVSTLKGGSIESITLQSRVAVTSVALIGSLPATGYPMDTLMTFLLMPMAVLAAGIQRKVKAL